MDLGLAGKVALVTGGSRGIGRATALSLAREECHVAICGRGKEALEGTLEELRSLSPRVWGKVADVTDGDDVVGFISGAAEELGGVDALVCNVGGFSGSTTLGATDEEWMATLDVNLMHSVRAIPRGRPLYEGARGGQRRHSLLHLGMETWTTGAVRGRQGRRDLPCVRSGLGAGVPPHSRKHGMPWVDNVSRRWMGRLRARQLRSVRGVPRT